MRALRYSHGQVAQSPGVQELTALLCVLNARLDRTEFSMVLQNAIQYQAVLKNKDDKMSVQRRAGTMVAGPMSARQVLSQVSPRTVGQQEASWSGDSGGPAVAVPEAPGSDSRELVARLELELGDIKRRSNIMHGNLAETLMPWRQVRRSLMWSMP